MIPQFFVPPTSSSNTPANFSHKIGLLTLTNHGRGNAAQGRSPLPYIRHVACTWDGGHSNGHRAPADPRRHRFISCDHLVKSHFSSVSMFSMATVEFQSDKIPAYRPTNDAPASALRCHYQGAASFYGRPKLSRTIGGPAR